MTTVTAGLKPVLDRFVDLTRRKRDLERDLRTIKDQLAPIEAELLDSFAAAGLKGVRHDETGAMVSTTRRVWARAADGDKQRACDALEAAGLGEYTEKSFNVQSLSAWFREELKRLEASGHPVIDLQDLLPDPCKGAIALTEDVTISVRQ